MTDTQRARELEGVTQADRDRAADAMKAGYISPAGVIDHVRAGRSDGNAFVQAFARHREAAATLPGREGIEAAAKDIAAERRRQIEVEGWTAEHDNEHDEGELARAAACYALSVKLYRNGLAGGAQEGPVIWPWDDEWWKPKDRRRDLIRAGALIVAEIERLDRAAIRALNSGAGR